MKIGNIEIYPHEVDSFKYWLHLFLDVLIIGILINIFIQSMPLDLKFLGLGVLFLGLADITVHSLLRLD